MFAVAVITAAPSSTTSARVRAATSQTAPAGWLGLPSYSVTAAPWVSAPSCMFHSAQPVEVQVNIRSPAAQPAVQPGPLQRLQGDAAVAVHQALGQPRGAGGEQHPQWVGELDLLELRRRVLGQQLVPRRRTGRVRPVEDVRDVDDVPQRRQLLAQPRDDVAAVDLLAVPVVAVRRDEHGGLELRQAPDDAVGAEVGEQHAHTAPTAAVARQAITACSVLGR